MIICAPIDPTIPDPCRPVRLYGCVKCQATHEEGDPLYREHLWRQDKHGVRGRFPEPNEVLKRIREDV